MKKHLIKLKSYVKNYTSWVHVNCSSYNRAFGEEHPQSILIDPEAIKPSLPLCKSSDMFSSSASFDIIPWFMPKFKSSCITYTSNVLNPYMFILLQSISSIYLCGSKINWVRHWHPTKKIQIKYNLIKHFQGDIVKDLSPRTPNKGKVQDSSKNPQASIDGEEPP